MAHVVIVGKYYPPQWGGVERYTADLARIAAQKHRVTVLVHNTEKADAHEQDGNLTIIRCGTSRVISSQPISPSMLTHLRSLRPDLIHFNAPNFWAAWALARANHRAPMIITHHADVFGRPYLKRAVMPIYRHVARRARCIVVNSLKNIASSRDLPRDTGNVAEIPWAVDTDRYQGGGRVDASSAERQRRFGNAPVVGFVGRFVRYKALPVLVAAISRLPEAHALLIGDGPLRPQIEQQIRTAALQDRVHLTGNLPEAEKIRQMGFMDVLAFPSNDITEAFGVVQVEAHLLGIPTVATSLPTGVTDVTIDGITGILVPPNDPDALAAALSRLLRDRDLAARLGAAGRERALRNYNMPLFERRFSDLFDAVLAGRPLDLASPTPR